MISAEYLFNRNLEPVSMEEFKNIVFFEEFVWPTIDIRRKVAMISNDDPERSSASILLAEYVMLIPA